MAKTILYLNHSYCTSVLDLQYYLANGINNKEMQQEVLAAFKDDILTNWLFEKGEKKIVDLLRDIPKGLTDSKLLSQICKVLVENYVIGKNSTAFDFNFKWEEHILFVDKYCILNGGDDKVYLNTNILVAHDTKYVEVFFELKIIRPCNEDLNFVWYNLVSNKVVSEVTLNLNVTKNSIKKISFVLDTSSLQIGDCDDYLLVINNNKENAWPMSIAKDESAIYMAKEMIPIPAGDFIRGNYSGKSDERPIHQVFLSSFLIGRYPVTQKLWERVMGSNPSIFRGENLPVHNVSWFDCIFFCNKLSLFEGLEECYSINESSISILPNKNGYRLPTEAEWECAARGGKNIQVASIYSGSNSLMDVGWYNKNSEGEYHPVGLLKPNEYDICDMSGNVNEWCWDWYDQYPALPCINPLGPTNGLYRVYRGGSLNDDASNCRVSSRNYSLPDRKSNYVGLRLVCIPNCI